MTNRILRYYRLENPPSYHSDNRHRPVPKPEPTPDFDRLADASLNIAGKVLASVKRRVRNSPDAQLVLASIVRQLTDAIDDNRSPELGDMDS